MGRHLSPRYGQVILVSGYPVLTAVNWSKHWCPICVHYQFSCAAKLARRPLESMRLNIVRDLVKQLTGQQTTSKQVTSPRWVDTWARDMVTGYWSVHILFWQLSIDHIVNVLFHKRCRLAETRLRHPSLPFDNLPYPSHTICRRVRTYVLSVNHVTTKRKEVDHIPWVWGSVPRALRARWSPADNQEQSP